MDYPQVRNATEIAIGIIESHEKSLGEERLLEVVCILANLIRTEKY